MQEGVPYVAVKSAQNMVTWLAACVHVWEVLFKTNITNGYFSIGQAEASLVKHRCQFIIDHLPPQLGTWKQVGDSKLEIKIEHAPGEYSAVRFMHSGEKAGRSISFYRVTLDEMAFMAAAEEVYNANRTRCRFLNCFSTPPRGRIGYFYHLYANAHELGIKTDLLHYSENPLKDEEWKNRMRRGMSEERWKREQECEFIAEGGQVYKSFGRDSHIVDPADFPIRPTMRFYRGIDWGWSNPFVHLWVASWDEGSITRWYVFREIYKTETLLKDLAGEITEFDNRVQHFVHADDKVESWRLSGRFTAEISDSESPRERHQLAEYGIRTIPCRKGKGSVNAKVDELGTLLEIKEDGIPGLIVSKDCVKTIFEFENYMRSEVQEGEHGGDPVKKWDHAMDALADIVWTCKGMEDTHSGPVKFNW